MDTRKSSDSRSARAKRDAVIAVVIAADIAVAVWSYGLGESKADRWAGRRERHAKVIHRLRLAREVSRAVKVAVTKRVSKEEFEELFGRIEPIDPSKHPEAQERDTHVCFHSESQRTFYLCLTDGGLIGYHSTDGPDDVGIPVPAVAGRQGHGR